MKCDEQRAVWSWSAVPAALALALCGCASSPPPRPPIDTSGPPRVIWEEHFETEPNAWDSPSGANLDVIARVYAVTGEKFLSAKHNASPDQDPPPAVHWGRPWRDSPLALVSSCSLRWRWRVRKHPNGNGDPWRDVAASVYVIMRTPTLLSAGKGFKFGWLSRPGPEGTKQRGLLQVGLRTDSASDDWQEESVNLCDLYRRHFGDLDGEGIVYIGVVSDADNSESVVEADYDDFVLETKP